MGLQAAKITKRLTVEEELRWKGEHWDGFEFHFGEILSMAGGTTPHALLCENLLISFSSALEDWGCRARRTKLKVLVEGGGNYDYSDLPVVCGKPQHNAAGSLLNSVLLAQALSPSTHLFDRNDKIECCQKLESLQACLLISQNTPRIEVVTCDETGAWKPEPTRIVEDLEETLSGQPFRLMSSPPIFTRTFSHSPNRLIK